MRKVRRYTKEQRGDILTGFASSGMKVGEYCQERKIPLSTFHTWRKNYPQEQKAQKKGFIKVNSLVSLSAEDFMQIETPKGYCIKIPTGIDGMWVRGVIEALKLR